MIIFTRQQPSPVNPFGLQNIGFGSFPVLVDIDADGDRDAFVGELDNNSQLNQGTRIFFFQNNGIATNPSFAVPQINPFGLQVGTENSSVTFADLDGDGDLDAFVGKRRNSGNVSDIRYFENTGSATVPNFAAPRLNPFRLEIVTSTTLGGTNGLNFVTFADIDGDGDQDAFLGGFPQAPLFSGPGPLFFLENTGTTTNPNFVVPTTPPFDLTVLDSNPLTNPPPGFNRHYNYFLEFVDLDNDGDLDAVRGDTAGRTLLFLNTGSATAPAFAAPVVNPLGIPQGIRSAVPAFSDLDGDGDRDLLIGDGNGTLTFAQNIGSASNPSFADSNPLGLRQVNFESTPVLVDIDADGDLDVMSGEFEGNIRFFRNIGSSTTPIFAAPETNPFGLADVGQSSSPSFGDLDGDGDLDALIGRASNANSGLVFYENTGSPTAPNFAASQANPSGLNTGGFYIMPTLVDIDADGDLDAFVGRVPGASVQGNILFFENIGTRTTANFAAPQTNAFGLQGYALGPSGFIPGGRSVLSFVDWDWDGDQDVLQGSILGELIYIQNIGTAQSPNFTTPQANPNGLEDVGLFATPTLGDLDGDGDRDLLVGEVTGNFVLFQAQSTNPPVPPTLSINSVSQAEGNSGTTAMVFTVTLSTTSTQSVSVDYASSNETAIAPTDYTAVNGTLTFAPGETSKTITVQINGDGAIEPDETLHITLTNPQNATIATDQGTGTIINDDAPIQGGDLGDILTGTIANDVVNGGGGNDTLNGQQGNDQLNGDQGSDRLVGGEGNDILNGGSGRDQLIGNAGIDWLTGGGGRDRFIYQTATEGRDRITDFNPDQDVIDLRRVFRQSDYQSAQPFRDYVRLVQAGNNAIVHIDSNGDTAGGFRALALLNNINVANVGAGNFQV